MTARRWLLFVVAGVAVVLIAGRVAAGVYAEAAWFDAVGAHALYFCLSLFQIHN